MDLGISGKRGLVLGASSGLGLAASQALAGEGVELTLFARDPLNLTTAADSMRHAVKVDTISGDITRQEDLESLAETMRAGGGLDILVLNTPRPPSPMRELLDEDDDERWEQAYREQLQAALRALRVLTPLILEGNDWGRIIGVTSASVKQPMPRHALSTIFRAGVEAALKHLSQEIAHRGVTVNSIAPATIATPTFSKFHNLAERVAATPLKRFGTLEEFGGTVAFLASTQAGYLTGQTLQLDGGRTVSLV